jgi:tungstate transport system substrate-binding protein
MSSSSPRWHQDPARRRALWAGLLAAVVATGLSCPAGRAVAADPLVQPDAKPDPGTIRTAVIGGMMLTGLWPEIARMFEEETDYEVVVVETGQRPFLDKAMRAGKVDVLTMHSGDITTNLVADAYGTNMRPWARNDLVIVGPKSDPAGIRGLQDGVEAFKRIYAAKANFVDNRGIGPREVAHSLWGKAKINPRGDWLIQDESKGHLEILKFAEQHNAYVIVGRNPILAGKLPIGNMEILVDQDPQMRRPYIVMEANPAKCPRANCEGARAFSGFLLGEKVQTFLLTFGKDELGGVNAFDPVETPTERP